jgi:hypothetical protein
LGIDCDFEKKKAVVYATTANGAVQIREEARAYEDLGIPVFLQKGDWRNCRSIPKQRSQCLIKHNFTLSNSWQP